MVKLSKTWVSDVWISAQFQMLAIGAIFHRYAPGLSLSLTLSLLPSSSLSLSLSLSFPSSLPFSLSLSSSHGATLFFIPPIFPLIRSHINERSLVLHLLLTSSLFLTLS